MREKFNHTELLLYSITGLLILIVYICGLFPEPIIDSAKYAAISRHIAESNEFINLSIHGEAYMQKPPLLFWLSALLFRIFGVSVAVFKLPTLIFSLLGIYSVYRLGSLVSNKQTGIIAAIIYSSCEGVFLYQMDVHTDILLTSNIIFSIWQLMEYLQKRSSLNFILGFSGIGLAMISKGLPGIAVPVFAISGYLVAKKDFRTLFSPRWLIGIPILLLFIYPALKGAYNQFGQKSLLFYFWSNNIDRIKGDYSGGRHDYFFSFHTLAYLIIPWTFSALTAFLSDFRKLKSNNYRISEPWKILIYSGVIPFSLIITISSQQAPHYLLPVLPLLAILIASTIEQVASIKHNILLFRILFYSSMFTVFILWSLILVINLVFFPTSNIPLTIPVIVILLIQLASLLIIKQKMHLLVIPAALSAAAFSYIINMVYMPSALKYYGPIQASYCFNKLADTNDTLYTYDYFQYETYFYPKNSSVKVKPGKLEEVISGNTCWVLTTDKGLNEIIEKQVFLIEKQFTFPFNRLSGITLKFLNPATRERTLTKIYLLKLKAKWINSQ